MIKWILSSLSAPIIGGVIDGYKAKLAAGNNQDRIAADLAGRELDVQKRELELQSEERRGLLGRWYEPTNLLGYIMVSYVGKVVLWDTVLGLGTTPALKGTIAEWAAMIIAFFVGKRAVENVSAILARAIRR